MDSSRHRTGEIVAGIGGIALFVFFLDRFGTGGFDDGGASDRDELGSSGPRRSSGDRK